MKPDGKFEVWRLDPGTHTLSASWRSASQTLQSAPVDVEVAGSNVENIELRIVPPFEIAGFVQYEDEAAKAQPPLAQQGTRSATPQGQPGARPNQPPKPPQPRLFLREVSGAMMGGQQQAEIAEDGSFAFHQIPPGRYLVALSWNNAYVKSGRLGTAELEGRILDLRNGAGGAPLTVAVSSGVAEVAGMVKEGDKPAAGRIVVLMPADGNRPSFASAGADGSYRIGGLPPGRYKLAAIETGDQSAMSGKGLDDYPDALEISLGQGDKLTKDLKAPVEGVR